LLGLWGSLTDLSLAVLLFFFCALSFSTSSDRGRFELDRFWVELGDDLIESVLVTRLVPASYTLEGGIGSLDVGSDDA
jgi:hypothetical protein